MRHITIVDGHPDPSEVRLNHALADRYADAARAAGHEVRRITLSQLHIPLLRHVEDFYHGEAPPTLRDAQDDIAWADHLVFFFPLWHGTMPSLVKAFIEQTFRPGFAIEYGGKNRFPKQLFKGKSARVVVTMGMPAFIYKSMFGGYGVKSFERSTLTFSGIAPVAETLLGGAGENRARAAHWLDLMDDLAQSDCEPEKTRRAERRKHLVRAAALLAASYGAYIAISTAGKSWLRTPPQDEAQPSATVPPLEQPVPDFSQRGQVTQR